MFGSRNLICAACNDKIIFGNNAMSVFCGDSKGSGAVECQIVFGENNGIDVIVINGNKVAGIA